jgi:hypothetical protein
LAIGKQIVQEGRRSFASQAARRALLLLALLVGLLLTGCAGEDALGGALILQGEERFDAGTLVYGDLVVIQGEITVAEGATIQGALFQLGGTVRIEGAVNDDVTIVDGALVLAETATVGGDLRLGGGDVTRSAGASVAGQVIEEQGAAALPLETVSAEPSPLAAVLRTVVGGILLGLLGVLLVRRAPRATFRVERAAVNHPLAGGALGVLVALVVPALLVSMAFTLVLIPLVFIVGALLLAAVVYGYAALGWRLGRWVTGRLPTGSFDPGPGLTIFSGAFLLVILMDLVSRIPLAGPVLVVVVSVVALGAVLLTRLGTQTFNPALGPSAAELDTYRSGAVAAEADE